jgi:hypothetical protein
MKFGLELILHIQNVHSSNLGQMLDALTCMLVVFLLGKRKCYLQYLDCIALTRRMIDKWWMEGIWKKVVQTYLGD